MRGQAFQRLLAAFDRTIFGDHFIALLRGREQAAHGEQGFASLRLKCDGDMEAHVLVLILAGVAIDQTLGLDHLGEDDLVLIVASVRAVHDETPHAAGRHRHFMACGGEAARSPPLHHLLGVGPGREHQRAWGIKQTAENNFPVRGGALGGLVHAEILPSRALNMLRYCVFSQLIIQGVPKRSTSMPKRCAQKVSWIGIVTWPPSEKALKIRSASAGSWTVSETEKPCMSR